MAASGEWLTNRFGTLGNSHEWFNRSIYAAPKRNRWDAAQFIDSVLKEASTPNGFFSIKIFPEQLYQFFRKYRLDPIREIRSRGDLRFMLLKRRDRLRQAVSLVRARQTGQWTSTHTQAGKAVYDFHEICRAWIHIGQSWSFWHDYCVLEGIDPRIFDYEDLLPDPAPWIHTYLEHSGTNGEFVHESELRVQRDDESRLWMDRFTREARELGVLGGACPPAPDISGSRLMRKFGKRLERLGLRRTNGAASSGGTNVRRR